jgi:hypothetical protein
MAVLDEIVKAMKRYGTENVKSMKLISAGVSPTACFTQSNPCYRF